MNGKRARLIRRYARVANKSVRQITNEWNGLPRTLPEGTKSGGEAGESKRAYGAEMKRAVAADEDGD